MTSVNIKSFSQSALKELAESQTQSPCLSLYMPTVMAGRETRQNSIRFKNLLGQSEEILNAEDENTSKKMLKSLEALIDDNDFWQHQSEGLAVFCSPEGIECYQVPSTFQEVVMVGNGFYLRPLIPLLLEAKEFFVLSLSQGKIRLFNSMTNQGQEIDLGDEEEFPTSVESALRFDDPEAQLQSHSSGGTSSGDSAAIYHGQGVAGTDNKEEIERFFQIIHPKIEGILKDTNAPLILAGVDFLQPIYRSVSNYPKILESSISGNVEHLGIEEICQQGWDIASEFFQQEHQQVIEQFKQQKNTNPELCAQTLEEVVFAALDGLVDSLLLVSTDQKQQWGRVDNIKRLIEIEQEPKNDSSVEELLNLAAVNTFSKGGNVYLVSEEDDVSIEGAAALLRGPVMVR